MNFDRLIAAAVAASFLLAAGVAQAEDQADGTTGASERPQHRPFKGPRGSGAPGAMAGQMLLRMADELNLSIEQQDSLQGLIDEFQPSWDSLRERMSASRSKMMGLTPDDPAYASVTQEVSQEAAALASEMVTLGSDFQVRAYALLTEEQQQRLEELKLERRDQRRHRGRGNSA